MKSLLDQFATAQALRGRVVFHLRSTCSITNWAECAPLCMASVTVARWFPGLGLPNGRGLDDF